MNDAATLASNCAVAVPPKPSLADRRAIRVAKAIATIRRIGAHAPLSDAPTRIRGAYSIQAQAEAEDRFLSRPDEDTESAVYFIYSAGKVKIGTTRQIDRRELALASALPNPIMLFLLMPGGTLTEYRLHVRFSAERLNGEWFKLSDELRAYIKSGAHPVAWGLFEAAEDQHLEWVRSEAKRLGLIP